jgi:hypothetical protein
MKNPLLSSLLAACLAVSLFPIHSAAQSGPAPAPVVEAEVGAVKFSSVKFGSDTWLEADVEIEAKPGGKLVAGQFVDRVRVIITIGMDSTDEKTGKPVRLFYRSAAEALTLEGGKSDFRFYFPPEIVKRDKLRTPLNYYAVELEVAGKAQAASKASYSSTITSAASLQNFISKAANESVVNEGLLIPQFLTPFSIDAQKRAPAFSRKEAQR